MRVQDILKDIMKNKEIENITLAKRLNITHSAIWERLNRKSNEYGITKLNEMLKAMDYKILIVPKERELRANEYEITT